MKLIDCSCLVGLSVVNHSIVNHENFVLNEKVSEAKDAQELLRYMDWCGIEQALVGHHAMCELDPYFGNRIVLKETDQCPERLLPTWTILPPLSDPEFAPELFFPEMRERGVRVLRAYPHQNRYFLDRFSMGEMLSEIERLRIPLILSPEHGYEYIYSVAREFPKLPVIVNNYGPWSHLRLWYPLMRGCKNVYFEIGDLETDGAIEEINHKFGCAQLLFGTEFPVNNMGGAIAMLMSSGISESDRANIAHGNIERLLGEIRL